MAFAEQSGFFEVQYLLREEDESSSVALVVLQGVGRAVKNSECLVIYEVVSGEGIFRFEDGKEEPVEAGGKYAVAPGAGYQDEGDLVMLVTAKPAFDPAQVEYLG